MRKRKRTSDLRRRTSIRSGGRCIRRSRGARVARSLKSDVGSRENARVLSPRRLFLTQSRRGAEDAEVCLKKRTGKVPAGLISIENVLSAPMPSPDGSPKRAGTVPWNRKLETRNPKLSNFQTLKLSNSQTFKTSDFRLRRPFFGACGFSEIFFDFPLARRAGI